MKVAMGLIVYAYAEAGVRYWLIQAPRSGGARVVIETKHTHGIAAVDDYMYHVEDDEHANSGTYAVSRRSGTLRDNPKIDARKVQGPVPEQEGSQRGLQVETCGSAFDFEGLDPGEEHDEQVGRDGARVCD